MLLNPMQVWNVETYFGYLILHKSKSVCKICLVNYFCQLPSSSFSVLSDILQLDIIFYKTVRALNNVFSVL